MNRSSYAERVEYLQPLHVLEVLEEKSRAARDQAELEFIVVNESVGLCNFRQAVFWHSGRGVRRLSGVVQIEANAPYVQWLNGLCKFLAEKHTKAVCLEQADLPDALSAEWETWLPQQILWIPLQEPSINRDAGTGGLLFASESGFSRLDMDLLNRWCEVWYYAWVANGLTSRGRWLKGLIPSKGDSDTLWWKRPYPYLILGVLLILQIPVDLTVLAPAELIPKDPIVVRSPLDGVIDKVLVPPNSRVEAGTSLFSLDREKLSSQLDIAQRKVAGLQTQYNQVTQLSLTDSMQKVKLAAIATEIDQKEAEIRYLLGQLQRSEVKADVAATVLYQAADELEGKPVQTGEGVMRLVNPEKVQIEAWLEAKDAVPITDGAVMELYLSSMPTSPVQARVFLMGYEPVRQPSGNYAYRVRAEINGDQIHRVGLKGIAKIVADEVPLYYWMLRRPLALLRQFLGV